MPQEITIVKCYKCNVFQTQIAKKSNKWSCVICGEKQSLKRIYGTGTGKDCRIQVQKLNEMSNVQETYPEETIADESPHFQNAFPDTEIDTDESDIYKKQLSNTSSSKIVKIEKKESKWLKYLDIPEKEDLDHDSN